MEIMKLLRASKLDRSLMAVQSAQCIGVQFDLSVLGQYPERNIQPCGI